MDVTNIATLTRICIAITRDATGFIADLSAAIGRVRDSDLNPTAINARARVLGLAADRLRAWLAGNGTRLRGKEREIVRESLEACERLVAALRGLAARSLPRRRNSQSFSRESVSSVFSRPRLERFSNTLNVQSLALDTIMQSLNLEGDSRRQRGLEAERTRSILHDAINSASTVLSEISALSGSVESDDESTSKPDSGYLSERHSTVPANLRPDAPLTEENLKNLAATRPPILGSPISAESRRGENSQASREVPNSDTSRSRLGPWRIIPPSGPPMVASGPQSSRVRGKQRLTRVLLRPREAVHDLPRRGGASSRTRNAGDDPGYSSSGSSDSQGTARPGRGSGPRRHGDYPRRRGKGEPDEESEDADDQASIADSVSIIRDRLEEIRGSVQDSASQVGDANIRREPEDILQELGNLIQEYRSVCDDNSSVRSANLRELDEEIQQLIQEIQRLIAQGTSDEDRILRGDDIWARTARDETGLHIAAKRLDCRSVRRFISRGADLEARDRDGKTPLLVVRYLSKNDEKVGEVVAELVAANANVQATGLSDLQSCTALHLAAREGSLSAVEALLAVAADVNALDGTASRRTPLHLACRSRSIRSGEVVAALLDAEADSRAQTAGGLGESPLDLALKTLKKVEREIAKAGTGPGPRGQARTKLFEPCRRLGAALHKIDLLLGHPKGIHLTMSSSTLVSRRLYTFRGWQGIASMPVAEVRERFRTRRAEMLMMSNQELHTELCRFHS